MQKKVEDILEAFENHRFEQALRQIDQLFKKIAKDTKKKNTLSDNQNRLIHLVKCGSLANVGKVHEAHHIMQTFFTDKVLTETPDKEKFMLMSIAQMAYDSQLQNKVDLFIKTSKTDLKLDRYLLSFRKFSTVSKTFLKQFVSQKRQQDGLAQIFLEYLNELNKVEPIENLYSKDLILRPNHQLNLKMVQLFFMKYYSGVNLDKIQNIKLKNSIIDFRIRLAIHSAKTEEAKKIYLENVQTIQENFVYLRSIREIPDTPAENHTFYVENCGSIFRRNLDIEKYVPLYDFYDEFLNFILTKKITTDFKAVWQSLQNDDPIPEEALYNFKQISNANLVAHYFRSLKQQLNSLTSGQKHAIAKKSDYYKISIKGLMLQLLKIMFQVAHKSHSSKEAHETLSQHQYFNQVIESYFHEFSKTFTYPNEMKNYFPFLKNKLEQIVSFSLSQKPKLKLPNIFTRPDDNLILLTNALKVLIVLNKEKLYEWKETENWVQLCWGFYQQLIDEVEQTKRREKGEIFLSDEFIVILADLLIEYVENLKTYTSPESQTFIESVLHKLMAIMDHSTQLSPFNGYLKLRLLYTCQKLNHFDKLYDTFISLDIKSVQFQTLGYFLLNPLISFNLYSQSQERLSRMIRSYHENQRQTSEYCLKALKAGTTTQSFQYFSYQKRLEKSFSLMNLFYVLYLQFQRKDQSQFYLDWIMAKLNSVKNEKKKINFNCDAKTMQTFIESLSSDSNSDSQITQKNEYYGIFTSPDVFELQINVRKLESIFRNSFISEEKTGDFQKLAETLLGETEKSFILLMKKQNWDELYDIQSNFNVISDYLTGSNPENKKSAKNQSFSFSKVKRELQFYLKLIELKIAFFNSFKIILALLNSSQVKEQTINQTKEQFKSVFRLIQVSEEQINKNMNWREQVKTCWIFRESLFTHNNLVRLASEKAGKLKKLPKVTKNAINEFAGELEKAVMASVTGIKFAENTKIDPSILELTIDKKYLEKNIERDQVLRRLTSINQKQAKEYLTK